MTLPLALDIARTAIFGAFVIWGILAWALALRRHRAPTVRHRAGDIYTTRVLVAFEDWTVARKLNLTPDQVDNLPTTEYEATLRDALEIKRTPPRRSATERRRWRTS